MYEGQMLQKILYFIFILFLQVKIPLDLHLSSLAQEWV
jgi:hypothetical protein